MKKLAVYFLLFEIVCRSSAQNGTLKKNAFLFLAENTSYYCKSPFSTYNYSNPSNDVKKSFQVESFRSNYNLKFGGEYDYRILRQAPKKNKSFYAVFAFCNLAWSKSSFSRIQTGTYSGGVTQYLFIGTIKEKYDRQYLNTAVGARLLLGNASGEILSFGINMERCRVAFIEGKEEYYNDADKSSWTNTGSSQLLFRQKATFLQRTSGYFDTFSHVPLNYYNLNFAISFGKILRNSMHLGIYCQLSLPHYKFFRKQVSSAQLYNIAWDSSFLINYTIFHYGTYFSF